MAVLRSPRYPGMSLEDAIENGRTIFEKDRRHPIAREVAAGHIGYKSLNGAADTALSALMQYGILEKVAKGEVRISQRAVDILHPDNERQRLDAIKSAGDSPALFRALDERFSDALPSNETLRSYLTRENFNSRAIGPIIAAYTKTRAFVAKECANDFSIPSVKQDADSRASGGDGVTYGGARVGDYVDYESGGAIANPEPMRVREVSEDQAWVFVDGSTAGLEMDQVIIREKPEAEQPKGDRPTLPLPPKPEDEAPLKPGTRKAVFPLDEGDVALIFPHGMSKEGLEELSAYLDIFLKKEVAKKKKPEGAA